MTPPAPDDPASDGTARNGTAEGGAPASGAVPGGAAQGGAAASGAAVSRGAGQGGASAAEGGAGRSGSGRGPGRRPGPTETREAILAAARELFAEKGYDGASLRAIARAAGVDPALVHHFFGNKEGVFTAAMDLPVDPSVLLPRLLSLPPERLGEELVRTFLAIWDDEGRRAPLLAMLRSAMTNERAAALMRGFLASALLRGRAEAAREIPALRIQAAAGQMIGLMILRYVLRVEPMASASEDELVALVGPALQQYLA